METDSHLVAAASLADYTRATLLIPALRERDIAGVISELSQALSRQGCLQDVLPFYHAALNRELLTDSAQACGIAFPHARLSGVKQLQFALGRAPVPISWGSKSSWPVRLVFLIAVPATDAACYLNLLASLARLGQQTELLADLREAPGGEAMMAVLEKITLRHI